MTNQQSSSASQNPQPDPRNGEDDDTGWAQIETPSDPKKYFLDWDTWDPMKYDYESKFNTLTLNPQEDPFCYVTGKVKPIPSKIGHVTICDHYARHGTCADGQFCDRVHIEPSARERIWAIENKCELNKDRMCLTFKHLSPNEIEPSDDSLYLVSVTNFKKPNDFYMIAPYNDLNFKNFEQHDIDFYINNVKTKSNAKMKLAKIHQDLKGIFDHKYRVDNCSEDLYVSQIVACKMDGIFRRAMVVKVADLAFEELYYRLQLLDIGVEVQLPREDIYDIKAECLSEPPMALNARLHLKPPNGELNWSKESIDFVEDLITKPRFLLCKITSYSEMDRIFTVDLFDCKDKKIDYTDLIIDDMYAEKITL